MAGPGDNDEQVDLHELCVAGDYAALKSALESDKKVDVDEYKLFVYRPLPHSSQPSDGLIDDQRPSSSLTTHRARMMTMDQSTGFGATLTDFPHSVSHPDIDWSVFENAERYLLRDDSAWITRLSKDFWWNLERISELSTKSIQLVEQLSSMKISSPAMSAASMQANGSSTRKVIGQRPPAARPPLSNIPDKSHFGSAFDQDIEYNPFQSKISFDNNIWTNYSQQAIPWQ